MTVEESYVLQSRKFVAPEFVCGTGVTDLVGRYAGNYGARKVFLVTDPGVSECGWTALAEESLRKDGIPFVMFDAVTPNPKDHEVMLGAEMYAREHCDVIAPELAGIQAARLWAGWIDLTPDVVPVIDHVADLPGLVVATGLSGHGFGIGPAAGELAAHVATGTAPRVDPAPFRLSRFA